MTIKDVIKPLIIKSSVLKGLYRVKGPSITILRYHSVLNNPADYEDTIGSSIIHSIDQFHEQMEIVSRHYNPISMDDVSNYLDSRDALPPYPVVITFDDGYKDNLDNAAPILDKFNIPATFYIAVDFVASKGNNSAWFMRVRKAFSVTEKLLWVDCESNKFSLSDKGKKLEARRAAMIYCGSSTGKEQLKRVEKIERELEVPHFESGLEMMLSWDDIRELRSSGHIIGSHSMSHPNLAYIKKDEAEFEIERSVMVLEEKIGESTRHFAYPNPILRPNWNKDTSTILKKTGYKTAVTCDFGCVRFNDNPLTLKRMYTPQSTEQLRWYIENTMNGFKL